MSVDELIQLGYQARRANQPEEALRYFKQAVEEGRQQKAPSHLAQALKGQGQIERDQRRFESAITRYEEAAAIERTLEDPLRIAHTIRHLGDMHSDPTVAEPYFVEALQIYRAHPETNSLDLANALRGYAILKAKTGPADLARLLFIETRDLYAKLGIQAGVDECNSRLAQLTP